MSVRHTAAAALTVGALAVGTLTAAPAAAASRPADPRSDAAASTAAQEAYGWTLAGPFGVLGFLAQPEASPSTASDFAPVGALTAAGPVSFGTVGPGSSVSRVKAVQYLLTARGYPTTADGQYGPQTTASVRRYQAAHGLAVDGSAGPITLRSLASRSVRYGTSGSAVKAAQRLLTMRGISTSVDGSFGPQTRANVVRFQQQHGLAADGVVGPITWSYLFNAPSGGNGTQPPPTQPGGRPPAGENGERIPMTATQVSIIKKVIGTVKGQGGNRNAQIIAIMTIATETRVRQLTGGDRDSVGLYQQRPSTGWGSWSHCYSIVDSTKAFLGRSPYTVGYTTRRGLLNQAGWESMDKGRAAQKVQGSAFPDRYAKWQAFATWAVDTYAAQSPAIG